MEVFFSFGNFPSIFMDHPHLLGSSHSGILQNQWGTPSLVEKTMSHFSMAILGGKCPSFSVEWLGISKIWKIFRGFFNVHLLRLYWLYPPSIPGLVLDNFPIASQAPAAQPPPAVAAAEQATFFRPRKVGDFTLWLCQNSHGKWWFIDGLPGFTY